MTVPPKTKSKEALSYYPFGSVMRSTQSGNNRYLYQGEYAEYDGETGWHHFELRNYDAVIGRWLSVDPYGQYASPYVGMGNDPVNMYDADGGWSGAFVSPFVRYGAFAAGGAVVGAGIAGATGGNVKRGAAIGAGAGLLIAAGLSTDWKSGAGQAASAGRGTISSATVREMKGSMEAVVGRKSVPINVILPTSELAAVPEPRETNYNDTYADIVEPLEGSPYEWGAEGPDAFDCSGTVCYGIQQIFPEFSRTNADGLFNDYTVPSNSGERGTLIFYDYTSDGVIDHVTTVLNSTHMLHPSQGSGVLQV